MKRRTVVHIDRVEGDDLICTVGGIDLPEASVYVPLILLPGSMGAEARPGRVFFAWANLSARNPAEVDVERVERDWGVTDGYIHFEA